jgi:hypothetical protein
MVYHSRIPLGVENLSVDTWNVPLSVMALAMNPQFEGWRSQFVGSRFALFDAAGSPVRYFPAAIDFRVSVSTRLKLNGDPPLYPLHTQLPPDDYLLKLRFQLKIFRGLHQTILQPEAVQLIGVPADIPYPDRVYRLSFTLPQVPTTDRLVLEVLAPSGERICKFHLDLA